MSGLLGLATLSAVTCMDAPTGTVEQETVTQLPGNLNPILHAKNSVTIGSFTQVNGDISAVGLTGSVLLEVSANQFFFSNLLANTVRVQVGATAGHIFGNDLIIEGSHSGLTLGLDPAALPAVPAMTTPAPGTVNVSTLANQTKQVCPGQYGAMVLGANSTLNLNGGVYHVTRLSLGEGARLQPSEPVVIVVSGNVVTSNGANISAHPQSLTQLTPADIRIEVAGAVTTGESNSLFAHFLVPNGKVTTGRFTSITGAVWAKNIAIGTQNNITGQGVFAKQTPSVPAPCNDFNACTADQCVTAGTVAFCRNAPEPAGTSCEDTNTCNGAELCDGAGTCQPGTTASAGTPCLDNNVCNGDEACNGFGTCAAGTPPVVNDGNACTADSCDPIAGVSNDPLPDGTTCSGVGVCEGGTCSVQGAVFSRDFVAGQSSNDECNAWNNFLDNQLTSGSFSSVSMSGTFDPGGVTCSDPGAATQICSALHNHGFASVFCNGHVWNVGQCGGVELSVDINVCFCSFNARTVRPCLLFGGEWGGVNTDTCFAPSQNITVTCQ